MDKWFDEKLDTKRLRKYTSRRIDDNVIKKFSRFSRQYSVTTILIAINVIVFFLSLFLGLVFGVDIIFSYLAIQPNNFFSGDVWTLITSMFMHANFTHLFVNMISLFFIGNFVERLIGRKRFLWLYLLSGIFAGIAYVFLAYYFGNSEIGARIFGSPEIAAVGASGAIFALGGLLAVLTPKLRVYVFFVIPMQMWTAMIALLLVLWAASISAGLPLGNTAHLGGLLVGVFYAYHLKRKYKRKTAMISQQFR